MDISARLHSLAAGPKPWLVTVTYTCGKVRALRQPREAMARNFAAMESRKIGREFLSIETGEPVRIESVTVTHSPE